jgi:hypothetical protein
VEQERVNARNHTARDFWNVNGSCASNATCAKSIRCPKETEFFKIAFDMAYGSLSTRRQVHADFFQGNVWWTVVSEPTRRDESVCSPMLVLVREPRVSWIPVNVQTGRQQE